MTKPCERDKPGMDEIGQWRHPEGGQLAVVLVYTFRGL